MDWDELRTAIRTAILADATLVALLASADAVYEPDQRIAAVDGCLTVGLVDEGLDPNCSVLGLLKPRIQISIYTTSETKWGDLLELLNGVLDIPRGRTTAIESTRYQIQAMWRVRAVKIGPVTMMANDKQLLHIATEWLAKVRRKP